MREGPATAEEPISSTGCRCNVSGRSARAERFPARFFPGFSISSKLVGMEFSHGRDLASSLALPPSLDQRDRGNGDGSAWSQETECKGHITEQSNGSLPFYLPALDSAPSDRGLLTARGVLALLQRPWS